VILLLNYYKKKDTKRKEIFKIINKNIHYNNCYSFIQKYQYDIIFYIKTKYSLIESRKLIRKLKFKDNFFIKNKINKNDYCEKIPQNEYTIIKKFPLSLTKDILINLSCDLKNYTESNTFFNYHVKNTLNASKDYENSVFIDSRIKNKKKSFFNELSFREKNRKIFEKENKINKTREKKEEEKKEKNKEIEDFNNYLENYKKEKENNQKKETINYQLSCCSKKYKTKNISLSEEKLDKLNIYDIIKLYIIIQSKEINLPFFKKYIFLEKFQSKLCVEKEFERKIIITKEGKQEEGKSNNQ